MAGNHGLPVSAHPGFQGKNAGIFGLSSFWRSGNSQLTLDSMGPLPLSIFGSEEAGAASSLARRSSMAGGFIILGVSLERGTSSFSLLGFFQGILSAR